LLAVNRSFVPDEQEDAHTYRGEEGHAEDNPENEDAHAAGGAFAAGRAAG